MDHSELDPQRLKPGLKSGSRLKPNLVRPSYAGGTPTAASQVKPSLLDKAGNIKPGLASGGQLKPSLRNGDIGPTMPPSIAEYWVASQGLFQDNAMTLPVTAAGQNVAKWVGRKAGTVLTATASGTVIAHSVGGLLVPKFTGQPLEAMLLPDAFATSRRDMSVLMHVQRPGVWQTRWYFSIGNVGRQGEIGNYIDTRLLTYDGTALAYIPLGSKASAFTISLRSGATGVKFGVNGTEQENAPWAAGSLAGGRFGNLDGIGVPSLDRVFGIAIGPLLSDVDYAATLAYFQNLKPIPSETAPTENWVVFGDSNTEGTNTVSLTSWLTKVVDAYPQFRIFPVVGAATFFAAGGQPQNIANTAAQIAIEKRAGAGKNRALFCTTNDFNNAANGSDYFAAVKTFGQALMAAGWEAWVMKFPGRTTPYTTTDTTYNANVAQFNALCVSDPWMTGIMDCSSLVPSNADGIHWTDADQLTIFNFVKSSLGI